MTEPQSETAAGDLLAAYLASVPRGLSATAWARWRGKNPPPCLRADNGDRCGVCGGEFGSARFCVPCHRRELGDEWPIFFERTALPDPCPTEDCDGRRVLGSSWCARCSDKAKRGGLLEGES